jgi:hypothetical protein
LGFASGSRFDLFELEPVGRALANAFLEQRVGKGGTSLRNWLHRWLTEDHEVSGRPQTLLQALSPEHPTDGERALVRSRLLETLTPASEKRQRLARAIGRGSEVPSIEDVVVHRLREAGHREQANEIATARAVGIVLDRARGAVAGLTRAVEPERGGVKPATLASDSALKRLIRDLRAASRNYVEKANTATVLEPTSRSFADAIVAADDAEAIRILVRRSGEVLGLADGSVTRGTLFRVVDDTEEDRDLEDGATSIEPDRTERTRTGRTFRIANLHSLLRDLDDRGAR